MHRSLQDRTNHNDDGMTVVEVVFAAAILLVGLTALLGMLMAGTGMSARARAQGLAVKTANQFIENVRAQKYLDLNQSRLNDLAAASSGTVGAMTTSIVASMTPHYEASQTSSTPPAYQAIRVLVTVTGPGFKSFRFSTGTYVREWQRSAAASRTPPAVRFDDLTPVAGTPTRPIFGSIHVGATAISNMPGVVVTSLYVKWGGSFLASSTPDSEAGSCAANWDTIALNAEGRRITLLAETWDALNQNDSNFRDFIIDNIRPPAPSVVTLSSIAGNSTATWAWPIVMDGESAAPDYVVTLYRMNPSGDWIGTAQTPTTAASARLPTAAFSRYYPSVLARGPRAVAGMTSDWVSPPTPGPELLTSPSFSDMRVTVSLQNDNKPFYFTATSLAVTPPTFPVTSPSYKWEYKIGSGAWTSFVNAASPNTNPSTASAVSYAQVAGPDGKQDLSFRCTATVTIGGVVTVVKSPIMTKTAAGNGAYTLSDFTATSW